MTVSHPRSRTRGDEAALCRTRNGARQRSEAPPAIAAAAKAAPPGGGCPPWEGCGPTLRGGDGPSPGGGARGRARRRRRGWRAAFRSASVPSPQIMHPPRKDSTVALNVHNIALNIHTVVLNIHTIALNEHTIALNISMLALNVHTVTLNVHHIALNVHTWRVPFGVGELLLAAGHLGLLHIWPLEGKVELGRHHVPARGDRPRLLSLLLRPILVGIVCDRVALLELVPPRGGGSGAPVALAFQ
eukprot:1183550-Prorocentrum_minimum.AAC.1